MSALYLHSFNRQTPVFQGNLVYGTNKSVADDYVKKGEFGKAFDIYKRMLISNPEDAQTHLDAAKTLGYQNRFKEAIPHLDKYLQYYPNDIENITFLGECYKKSGMYSKSIECFQKALSIEPKYDYAHRNLLDAKNLYLLWIDPKKARAERYEHSIKTLNEAIKIAKDFLPKDFTNDMKDITVCFDKTATMGGRSNIAQYEHSKRRISITDDYTYANPKLLGAYLIHEFIHGKDNDAYTSVREEQDAYRAQAEYWTKNVKDVFDPEMDYVAELYKKSSKALDDRVAEIYKARDPYIAETSYNHPPYSKNIASHIMQDKSTTPLRAYEIIV